PGVKRYPAALEDLLADKRFPGTERHLRRIYADPFTGKADWVLMQAPGGGIMGVHSKSTAAPVRNGPLVSNDRPFQGAKTYQEWQFFYDAHPASSPPGAAPAAPAPYGTATGMQMPVISSDSARPARAR